MATWFASAFAVVLILTGLIAADDGVLTRSIGPATIALVGWAMIELKRPNVAIHLMVGMAAVIFMVAANNPTQTHDALFGFLAMGVGGAVFVRRRVWVFVGITAVGIAMIGYWHGLTLDGSTRFQTAFGSAGTYVFMAWLIIWMKGRWLDAQRELEELIRSKDELVASISHELRTPMTTVVGLARELDERFADFGKGEVEEFIRLIVDESGDVANILEDLLVAASADIGTLSFDLHTVELVQEIDAALSVAPEATIDMPEGARSIEVLADAGRVRQILRNLVVNAARYGGPNRRIVLERKGEMASIAVCDDGDPIPQGERNRIFEAYRRRDAASAVPGSVGLGLTVSRELARQMGGDLIYTHDGVEGSFTLTLPLAPPRLDRSETEVEVTPLAM
jgi:signal transduction histidine kinase